MIEPEFFVLGLPRSGTTWLAKFFAGMNPEVLINHEAVKMDFYFDKIAAFAPWAAREYILGGRAEHIAMRQRARPRFKRYGEITPRCRYISGALRDAYPDATFVHLVRDPRKAVVSMLNYGYYSTTGRPHRRQAPDAGRWSDVRRACWGWAYGHHRLRRDIPEFVRIEDLLSDFAAVENLGRILRLDCSREAWEKQRQRKVNASRNFRTPPFEEWPPSWRREMEETLGDEAIRYGYPKAYA
ncbi:MAG TPA: sulfotransferase [Planctomycetota bacterium]|nr:sulfotransferase [Planctomycetota bacterium]